MKNKKNKKNMKNKKYRDQGGQDFYFSDFYC